ncbi:hypothetical protein CAL18_17945 [Bordetella genomosp. 7]|uniref:Lipoprotein n=2 Tax=Alcaligenaceae TaxID=506 RepID=A0A261QW39_9BORD|nr:hypothetical protein CAL18_17945 [Bordetella genomosp. 7]OZI16602.1 hypothetical protein CAL19_18180 [Bordetella genomosp. 7]
MSHLAHGRMVLRIVATLAATSLVAACGFKGPLYLPPESGQTGPTTPPPPQIPAPATLP